MPAAPILQPFPHPWRDYQARVLAELDRHLNNDQLHVVAPPGSGKTVLGLEVVRRLAQPTLILAPTIALREQWIARLCEGFLGASSATRPDWVSTDLDAPGPLTVVTYQAVLAAFESGGDDDDQRWQTLGLVGTAVLVCDEAHHLKRAWWHALDDLRAVLTPTVVALTATPPYDVSATEWARYTALAGSVDAEIEVPELIASGDLAPHQDLLYLTPPDSDELTALRADRTRIDDLLDDLLADGDLARALMSYPPLLTPREHLDAVLATAEGVRAACVYLERSRHGAPPRKLLRLLRAEAQLLPPFGYAEAEALLEYLLEIGDAEPANDLLTFATALRPRLKRLGVLRGQTVDLRRSRHRLKLLRAGDGKLQAVGEIARIELANRGADLRLAVLTDFIRAEWLGRPGEAHQLGAVPVWEALIDALPEGTPVGLLTGSLVILPTIALKTAPARAARLTGTPLAHRSGYERVAFAKTEQSGTVALVTRLFTDGHVRVLAGTRALLGEGWDAPALNALVVASASAAFVTACQVRGRALRRARDKVANVWHLACIDPAESDGGADFAILRRRFRAFVGVTHDGPPRVANGLSRLDPNIKELAAHQTRVRQRAGELSRVRERWTEAVRHPAQLHEGVEARLGGDPYARRRRAVYRKRYTGALLASFVGGIMSAGMAAHTTWQRWSPGVEQTGGSGLLVGLIAASVSVFLGMRAYHWWRRLRRERAVVDAAEPTARAVVAGLRAAGLLGEAREGSEAGPLRVTTEYIGVDDPSETEGIWVGLQGGTHVGARVAAESLAEVFGAPTRARYLLRVGGRFRLDAERFVSVPRALSGNKALARGFAEAYRREVGACELLSARSDEGRQALLRRGY